MKVNASKTLSSREMEAEEIANRRSMMLDHFKVVREFSKSNIPIMIDGLCNQWESELITIRTKETLITNHNETLILDIKGTQE